LRLLAAQVATDFIALAGTDQLAPRSGYDKLLLTAHLRVNADTEAGDDTALEPSEDTG
jgi:hypothetical protein